MYYVNCFFVYSILGFILEMLVCYFTGSSVESGILYGPWTPIYGIASILIIVISEKLFRNLHLPRWVETIIVFFIVTFLLTLLEWLGGFLIELIFGFSFWDYSDYKFNLGKYVCLEIALVWGLLSIIFIYVLRPFFDKYIVKIPKWITIGLIVLIVIDFVIRILREFNFI